MTQQERIEHLKKLATDMHGEWARMANITQDTLTTTLEDRQVAYASLPILKAACVHLGQELVRAQGFGHYIGGGIGPADPNRPFENPDRPWVPKA